nr:MAG TPA: hypothetical protein [Bacteriophage sp.]
MKLRFHHFLSLLFFFTASLCFFTFSFSTRCIIPLNFPNCLHVIPILFFLLI